MLFLKTDNNADATELTGSQREDCLVSILILTSKITVVAVRQCFHMSVKPSRLVKVSMILLNTRLNELKMLLANPQKIKTSQGMFWF